MKLGEKKFFENNGEYYSALNEAKSFLDEEGYSYGEMSRGERIAIKKGDYDIGKWRNLSTVDLKVMDGYINHKGNGYKRDGVGIVIFDSPPINVPI